MLGLLVPLGKWSDAVGRVKMGLCQRAGDLQVLVRERMEGRQARASVRCWGQNVS